MPWWAREEVCSAKEGVEGKAGLDMGALMAELAKGRVVKERGVS